MKTQTSHETASRSRAVRHLSAGRADDRRGSTIIVVLALLGALMLLGFLVYTIAAQNQVSATYFADAAKVSEARIDPDVLFNNVLRQIIVGPDDAEWNSALWGGDKSLLATLFGRDLQPYTGRGVHLGWDGTTNRSFVDQNYNNMDDATEAPPVNMNSTLLEINKSPAAQGIGMEGTKQALNFVNRPDPDVDYTTPDINSPFLSYNALVPDGAGGTVRVVIPSFHRPQILRNVSPAGPGDWYTNLTTAKRVLRPHVEHRAIADDGTVTVTRRFVSATHPDTEASPLPAFPFPMGTGVQEGIWNKSTPADPLAATNYDLDLDGDGIKEAVYLDLGFPMLTSPDGLTSFVPLAAITIKCADSRFNLNAHGNIYGDVTQTNVPFGGQVSGQVSGQTQFISKSDTGYGFWEVNPQYGLRGIPGLLSAGMGDFSGTQTELDAALEPHRIAFRSSPNPALTNNPQDKSELSNMEWWFLLTGRADFLSGGTRNDITVLHAGRWGETPRLSAGIASRMASDFPLPGSSTVDDNNNLAESGPFQPGGQLFPSTVLNALNAPIPFVFPAFRHPIDLFGSGRRITAGMSGKRVDLFQQGRMSYAQYRNYTLNSDLTGPPVPLGYLIDNSQLSAALGGVPPSPLLVSQSFAFQINEPGESIYDPSAPPSQTVTDDSLLGPDENASLELPTAALSQLGKPGRVLALAPYNFWASSQAQEIRRLFATTGWDLKSHGQTFYGRYTGTNTRFRRWEWNADTDNDGNVEFPPQFPGATPATQPFRDVLRDLLTVEERDPMNTGVPNPSVPVKMPQRKFSINGVLDKNLTNGRLFFRPLTPHPTGLDRDQIVTRLSNPANPPTRPNQIVNVYDQEYLARRDRQLMCRDIYVMLYTFCGSSQSSTSPGTYLNYTGDNASKQLYFFDPAPLDPTVDQLKQMAQFAVNLVDALDPDDNITLFEYDKNLGNGWSLDDNPYTDEIENPVTEPVTERGVVSGVEAQTLCFNEALATLARKVQTAAMVPFNHPATEYDDTNHRDFLHVELQNISSRTVRFDNDAWQIVVRPVVTGVASVPPIAGLEERRLTLTTAAPGVGTGAAPGSLYTIGTAGDNQNVDVNGNIRPSFINVNIWYQHPMNDLGTFTRIAPRGGLNLDLMTAPINTYDVVRKQSTGNFGDGSRFPSTTAAPSGAELLELGPSRGDIDNGEVNVELVLRRRADLRRAPPILFDSDPLNHVAQSKDNPWVVVDKLTVPLQVMALAATDNYVQLQSTHLRLLFSRERLRALHGSTNGLDDGLLNASFQMNSLGLANDSGGAPIPADQAPLWHPHFDRDFTSVAELLDVPTYGPDELTHKISALTGSGSTRQIFLRGDDTAGAKFLQPRGGPVGNVTASTAVDDNLWYRLLGLVEVPTRADRHFETPSYTIDAGRIGGSNPLGIFRVPGRIQLNTLAHPEVLMGLLDDQDVVAMTLPPLPTTGPPVGLTDQSAEAGRDWWTQFLRARDGLDPISGLPLPGVPGISKPFHGLSFAVREQDSIQNTVLRALPLDAAALGAPDNARELFEIGTLSEHRSATSGTTAVDYSNRHRLLGKVLDNSTTRSNVFLVYIQIDYFSARKVTDSTTMKQVVRIGAKLANSPAFRSFYVIDRAKAADRIQRQDLPAIDPTTNRFLYTFPRSFDYRALILHQQRIQ